MVERGQSVNHAPTMWWCGGSRRAGVGENEMDNWTEDANKARRFPTAEEAQKLAENLFGRNTYRVTEHLFLDLSPGVGPAERIAQAIRDMKGLKP